jgi:glycosyltransferase involved in cell wall biosynthesis
MNFSIIIPVFNESQNPYFEKGLKNLTQLPELEIICVDKGSDDGTVELINKYPHIKYIHTPGPSRSIRMQEGVKQAKHERILLHHPRSIIDTEVFAYLKRKVSEEISWAGLTHQFDWKRPLLSFTSWYSNHVRLKIRGIIYLDHCLYFRRDRLKEPLEIFPSVDIFEDTLISLKLREKMGTPYLLPYRSLTSSIRFKKNGPWKQAIMNQYLKVIFALRPRNSDHQKLNRLYEDGLDLNTKY